MCQGIAIQAEACQLEMQLILWLPDRWVTGLFSSKQMWYVNCRVERAAERCWWSAQLVHSMWIQTCAVHDLILLLDCLYIQ